MARRTWRRIAGGAVLLAVALGGTWALVVAPRLPAIRLLRRLDAALPDPSELAAAMRGGTHGLSREDGASRPRPAAIAVAPPSAAAPVVIAVAGVTDRGIEDLRVHRLVLALRAAGVGIEAPQVEGLARPGEGGSLVEPVVATWAGVVASRPGRPVALVGISLGAGVVLHAITRGLPDDPDPRTVSAVLLVGLPDDTPALVPAWFRRPIAPPGATGVADARSDGGCFARHRVARAAAASLVPEPDLAAVRAWLDALGEDPARAREAPSGLASAAARRLVEAVRAEDAIRDADLAWVAAAAAPYLAASSPAAIDPARLARLTCPVFVLHGVEDPIVPVAESERLATRLRAVTRVETLASRLFSHVELGAPGLAETWRHVAFVQRFLDAAASDR